MSNKLTKADDGLPLACDLAMNRIDDNAEEVKTAITALQEAQQTGIPAQIDCGTF